MIVRELVTVLGFETDTRSLNDFEVAVNAVKGRVRKLKQEIEGVGKVVRNVGLGLTAFVTTPLTLMGIGMIKTASDAEEAESKFKQVFSSIEKEANKVAENLVKNFGRARDEAKMLLGTTGDLLVGFGFTEKEALSMAKQVNELAVDLASFSNVEGGAERASMALTKGLLGERESMKLLGIAVNENTQMFKDEVKEIQRTSDASLLQAKAMATLRIAQLQSQKAIGDFQRTIREFANQWRLLTTAIRNVAVSYGKLLLPMARIAVIVFRKLMEILDKLPKPLKIMITAMTLFVMVVGPALFILGLLIVHLGWTIVKFVLLRKVLLLLGFSWVKVFKWMGKALLLFTRISLLRVALTWIIKSLGLVLLKFVLIASVVAVVAGVLVLFFQDLYTWVTGGDSLIGDFLGSWVDLEDGVIEIVGLLKDTLRKFFTGDLQGFKEDMEMWGIAVLDFFRSLADDIEVIFGKRLADFFRNMGGWIARWAEAIGGSLGTLLTDPKAYLQEWKELLAGPGGEGGEFGEGYFRGKAGQQGIPGTKGGGKQTNVVVRSTIGLNFPPGTREEYVTMVDEKIRPAVREELSRMAGEVIVATEGGD